MPTEQWPQRITRADGRIEFICIHGVGHPARWVENTVHGCDGCCSRDDFPGKDKEAETKWREMDG